MLANVTAGKVTDVEVDHGSSEGHTLYEQDPRSDGQKELFQA